MNIWLYIIAAIAIIVFIILDKKYKEKKKKESEVPLCGTAEIKEILKED